MTKKLISAVMAMYMVLTLLPIGVLAQTDVPTVIAPVEALATATPTEPVASTPTEPAPSTPTEQKPAAFTLTEPEEDAVGKLIDSIEALPALDDSGVDDENKEAFEAWLAGQREIYAGVPALYEKLSAYAEDDAAMERIGEERANKLAEINALLFGQDEVNMLLALNTAPALTGETNVTTISSRAEFLIFKGKVDGGDNYAGKTVKLMSNFALTKDDFPVGWHDGTHYSSTAVENCKAFKGTFDGNGKTIRLEKKEAEQTTHTYIALFAKNEGTITNLTVEGGTLICDLNGDRGMYYAGIAAYNSGTVTKCRSSICGAAL